MNLKNNFRILKKSSNNSHKNKEQPWKKIKNKTKKVKVLKKNF